MERKIVSLFLLIYLSLLNTQAQDFNRPVPGNFPPYEFEQLDTTFQGYYFTSANHSSFSGPFFYIGLIGPNGYLIWWAKSTSKLYDFKYIREHNEFTIIGIPSTYNPEYYRIDSMLAVIDTLKPLGPFFTDIHEYLTLNNGNRAIITIEDSVLDLSAYTFSGTQGDPNTNVRSNSIREYDSLGNEVFSWNSLDHIHPSEFIDGYNYNPGYFDYAHANSIDEDDDGHLLVSFRHLDAVYKIHRQTGEVIWRLGGASSDFLFPNDPNAFSGQHSFRRAINGRYGLFDNGNQKPGPKYTRVAEYELDTISWTANLMYEYDAGQSIYAPATGSYQHDVLGYKCIGWGYVRRPEPSATLLDENGNIISQIHFKDSIVSYRVWAYELPFDLPRPMITCVNNGGSVTLSAPSGYNEYLWSSGESSQSITVTSTGTGAYMVWVKYGIGMLGSFPVTITDIDSACASTGLDEFPLELNEKIEGYYDLSGRKIKYPEAGRLYIKKYDSGRVEWGFK